MDFTDDTGHLALAYVSAVQRQGYRLTVEEFESFMARPNRRPGVPERRQQQPAALVGLSRLIQQAQYGFQRSILAALETQEVVISEGRPAETLLEWLSRLRWLRVDDGRVLVTSLGEAMLAHLEQADVETEIPLALTLDRNDELARARVFAKIAELGSSALVDPYFSMEGLLQVVRSTAVTRVLTSERDRGKLAGVQVTLAGLTSERTVEVRKSDAFHDRFVFSDEGPVWLLGTSLTGVGHRLSVMVQIADETTRRALRAEFDSAWQAAESVLPADADTKGSNED